MTPEYLSDDDLLLSRRSRRLAALESEIDTPVLPSLKPWHWGVAAGVVVAVVGVLWLVNGKTAPGGIPLIAADTKPFKIKPENPGGTEVPFQEMQVYSALPGSNTIEDYKKPDGVEKIIPPPEEPVERPGLGTRPTRIVTAENAAAPDMPSESLFDRSEEGEMPPPAGKSVEEGDDKVIGHRAADEDLPGYVAETAPPQPTATAPVPPGTDLLPSDMVDVPSGKSAQLAQAQPESLLANPDQDNAATLDDGPLPDKPQPDPVLTPTTEKPASDKPVSLLAEPSKPATLPTKRVPVVEGMPIRATGPTAKTPDGKDVIEIRSPDREKPVEIHSEKPVVNPSVKTALPANVKPLALPGKSMPAKPAPVKAVAAKPATSKNITITNNAPAVKTSAGAGGGWRVQIAAVPAQNLAASEWKRYQARYHDLLGPLNLRVQKADLGAKGIFYRLQGGVLDRAAADKVCADLRGRGGSCMVVRD